MYKIRHKLKCPDCKADLRHVGAIDVHYSAGGHEFDLCSQLDEAGLLQDEVDGLIAKGLHAGSTCTSCSEELEELEELEGQASDKGNLTWNNLLNRIQEMDSSERFDNITVHTVILGDFHPVTCFGVSKDGDAADGILDHGHLYLEVDG